MGPMHPKRLGAIVLAKVVEEREGEGEVEDEVVGDVEEGRWGGGGRGHLLL